MLFRFFVITFLFMAKQVHGQFQGDNPKQNYRIDSLMDELSREKIDSVKLKLLQQIGQQYRNIGKIDSSILFYDKALEQVEKMKMPVIYLVWQLDGLEHLAAITGNYLRSAQYANKALVLSAQINDNVGKAFALAYLGEAHSGMGDLRKALDYYFQSKKAFEISESGHWAIQHIAETYLKMHMLDSALYYNQMAYYIADTGHNQQYMIDFAIRIFANIYSEKGDYQKALKYYYRFIDDFYHYNLNNREIGQAYFGLANLFLKNKKTDSAIVYLDRSLKVATAYNDQQYIFNASRQLSGLYDSLQNEHDAFKYFKAAMSAKDSMTSLEKIRNIQNLSFNQQIREKERQEADAKQRTKTRMIIIVASVVISLVSFLIWNRLRQLRLKHKMILEQKEAEKLKVKYEKELLALEAKALRAQMNPHFIYNCMNSIKALIQIDDKFRAVEYLTTFSKLMRTIFHNSDKRQISLYDEIETCKLYTQLESMRLNGKLQYGFYIDPNLDLKSVMVPALIVQPFIENAIWHGIVPKDGGTINISIQGIDETIICEVDDNGIGRESSKLNKPITPIIHDSKGVYLSQQRLNLEKMLNDTNASIEIIDKYENNSATGTKVILNFNLN